MKPLGSVAAVVAAILEDAAAEVEAVERETAAAIDGIRAEKQPDDGGAAADARVSAARARARRRIAQEDWEDARQAMSERERWIEQAARLGRARLADRDPAAVERARLTRLAREALARLPAGTAEVVVSDADALLLGPEWCVEVATGRSDPVRVVAGTIAGGCLVRSADGRASFDNSYAAREERLQAVWRAALAALYADVTGQFTAAIPSAQDASDA